MSHCRFHKDMCRLRCPESSLHPWRLALKTLHHARSTTSERQPVHRNHACSQAIIVQVRFLMAVGMIACASIAMFSGTRCPCMTAPSSQEGVRASQTLDYEKHAT